MVVVVVVRAHGGGGANMKEGRGGKRGGKERENGMVHGAPHLT